MRCRQGRRVEGCYEDFISCCPTRADASGVCDLCFLHPAPCVLLGLLRPLRLEAPCLSAARCSTPLLQPRATSVSSIQLHVCSWGCCALFSWKPLASVPPAAVRLYSGHAHAAPKPTFHHLLQL